MEYSGKMAPHVIFSLSCAQHLATPCRPAALTPPPAQTMATLHPTHPMAHLHLGFDPGKIILSRQQLPNPPIITVAVELPMPTFHHNDVRRGQEEEKQQSYQCLIIILLANLLPAWNLALTRVMKITKKLFAVAAWMLLLLTESLPKRLLTQNVSEYISNAVNHGIQCIRNMFSGEKGKIILTSVIYLCMIQNSRRQKRKMMITTT